MGKFEHEHSFACSLFVRPRKGSFLSIICGYKSLNKVAAEHLFNHISLRAGMRSTIITTNLGFDRWDEIFTDKIIAAAIVDRLTFKSFIIDMNGPSYRLKATEQWINERKNTDKRHK